ncbi:cobalamin-binding protein [Caldimonas thermodepolymerans]|jgi:iron complex transport system substrate-binding protein|uniref:Cobalamin-binding protein n=1 Tax=Caldimonas thermodepolymerans TaxID=215580 RepID=A0A2S5T6C4_9BURK|nr:cobalamin-binding protein [Caldimonas thermodepolymerans]PPE70554.1 cobalamin-binding protein [Caldimonas thermodepolymerans]QPC30062.1 cobalamin-binding protein [Caldimonas thermodepolymerans]RDH97689.1 iron complex transport system substrate-binding protein [Caldimonas thermodepolymerans]TCP10102.1 iron complex transport system substrate-binding protein [Caldimonas thermodepolymerans]UZG42809.1 cobalamin-binding protein [Caldimonas thermodepolymerans]
MLKPLFAGMLALGAVAALAQPVSVIDDHGDTVTLQAPARRVVSVAPHLTELLFAAGGGERIVGTVDYSDHPPQARDIVRVGDSRSLDLEAIAALKPDLVVVWREGNSPRQIDKLRRLGIPMYQSEPRRLDDIGASLLRLGRLLGTEPVARREAQAFAQGLAALRERYAGRAPVRTFYQVWRTPLMTLNDRHMVSDVIRLCGGVNVFGHLDTLVPTLDEEAVLQADPEVILTAAMGATPGTRPVDGLEGWKRFSRLQAVARDNLYAIDGDLLNRPTPRLLQGAARVCEVLDEARAKRR